MTNRHLIRARAGRAYAAFIAYLLGFFVLLLIVSRYYLLPAFAAAAKATPPERRVLAIHSRLLLAVVLFVLLMLMIVTFRISRFFLREDRPRKPTVYPDAWQEAARRIRVPEEDEEDSD